MAVALAEATPNPSFSLTFRSPDKLVLTGSQLAAPLVEAALAEAYWPGLIRRKPKPADTLSLRLHGAPFKGGGPKLDSLAAKSFCCRLLQLLPRSGWRLAAAPILSVSSDASSWFFVADPAAAEEPETGVCCVHLSQLDSLLFVQCPESLQSALERALADSWPDGVQQRARLGDSALEVKLRGSPWTAQKAAGVAARRLVLAVVAAAARSGWRLQCSARLKVTNDSLFFRQQSPSAEPLMLMSLHSVNSVRVVGTEPLPAWLPHAVAHSWPDGMTSQQQYHGAVDIRLSGSPWLPTKKRARAASRLALCQLLQQLRARGWYVVDTLDITRRYPVCKSAFLLVRGQPDTADHCCLMLDLPARLHFVQVPDRLLQRLLPLVHSRHAAGVAKQRAEQHSFLLKLRSFSAASPGWRLLLADLLTEFQLAGWELVCTGNVSGRFYSDDSRSVSQEVHSWWFAEVTASRRKFLESQRPQTAAAAAATTAATAAAASPPPPDSVDLVDQRPPSYDSLFR